MPELAEVEYYRKQWDPGIGDAILRVDIHPEARVYRGADVRKAARALRGKRFLSSATHGKNLLFSFSDHLWIGGHLGMTGNLLTVAIGSNASGARLHRPGSPSDASSSHGRHNHLVLVQETRSLLFCDPRMFGKITFHTGERPPAWWRALPPEILSPGFTKATVHAFIQRHPRPPIKTLLLDQRQFPGIGNWMADEILWRCGIAPLTPAGALDLPRQQLLWKEIRAVSRNAMRVIGTAWKKPPDTWLFNHRWSDGGVCPHKHCGGALLREDVRGRTTCWCPRCQAHT